MTGWWIGGRAGEGDCKVIVTTFNKPEINSPLLTTWEASEYLKCNPRTLAEWRMNGRGPRYVRAGRRAFYRQTDLDEWLEARVFQATAEEQDKAVKGVQ